MENISPSHEELVSTVIVSHFKQPPTKTERMKTGMDNEVYGITVLGSEYIVRLNTRESLKGSSKNIPLFKSLGIEVPEIVAEDYSKTLIPYNWQIQTRLEGTDISNVIPELTEEQLKDIAGDCLLIPLEVPERYDFFTLKAPGFKERIISVVKPYPWRV